jgi:hypothetical protein
MSLGKSVEETAVALKTYLALGNGYTGEYSYKTLLKICAFYSA